MADVALLLANSAEQAPGGLVHALGIGWTEIATPTPPFAMVVTVRIPWEQAGRTMKLDIDLIDSAGKQVSFGTDDDGKPVPFVFSGEFDAQRPDGVKQGTPLESTTCFNIGGGLPLAPGRYQWRLSLDGKSAALRAFRVHEPITQD